MINIERVLSVAGNRKVFITRSVKDFLVKKCNHDFRLAEKINSTSYNFYEFFCTKCLKLENKLLAHTEKEVYGARGIAEGERD